MDCPKTDRAVEVESVWKNMEEWRLWSLSCVDGGVSDPNHGRAIMHIDFTNFQPKPSQRYGTCPEGWADAHRVIEALPDNSLGEAESLQVVEFWVKTKDEWEMLSVDSSQNSVGWRMGRIDRMEASWRRMGETPGSRRGATGLNPGAGDWSTVLAH